MNELIETEVLVIGTGIAGCTAAIALAERGVQVTLVTRAEEPSNTNTDWAQGGIIYKGEGDSAESLIRDLDHAGANFTNPEATKILAAEGPELVKQFLIDKIGVDFTRKEDGELSIVLEGAHEIPRIIHSADTTGHAIQISLLNYLKNFDNIELLTAHTAIDLLTPQHHSKDRLSVYNTPRCVGAYLFDRRSREVKRCLAKQTVLATGGLGQIFAYTSNPKGSRGDGLAMAYRAGARVINNEFVQFHPTTFSKRGAPNFLISEAVRGEGGRLVLEDGTPFMQNYDSEWKDLAARDVVARSIRAEMLKEDVDRVFLDLRSYIPTEEIKHHFPNIYQTCLSYGVDITTELVPVTPAAHYFCGGVWVDGFGRSSVKNLYAIGEVSCTGLHGANRLASSSLLEGIVWGQRSAEHIVNQLGKDIYLAENIPAWRNTGIYEPDPLLIQQDMTTIKNVMWNYVGLVRASYLMNRAMRELNHLEAEIERFYKVSKLTDDLIGLRNAVMAGKIVTRSAQANKRSMGAHFRSDSV